MSDERPNAPEDESAEPQPEKAPAFPEVEPKERKGEKAEAPKTEEPKTEEPKTEEPKAKEPKSEKPLAEKPKGEKPKDEKEDDWAPRPIVGTRAAWGLVVLSAILCPVGFVGIGVWPVAFVAWVPLIIALRGQSPRRALAFGWVAGFAMTMVGFYWLVSMLETFSGFPLVLCVLFAAVLCIQKGGRIGLMALLYAYATRKRWHHGLAFLAAFAVSELVYPLLFPWYYGASVHGVPILMQTAELGGPIAVSIVILAVNVAVAEVFEKPLFSLPIDKRTVIGGLAVLPLALIYGAVRMSGVDARIEGAKPVKIGMVQGNMPLKGRSRAIPVHLQRTAQLREQGAELVVWSEAAVSRAYDVARYENEIRRGLTRLLGTPAIVGAVLYERNPTRDAKGRRARFYNTALITEADGTVKGRYDKQFLLMFGEYLPFGDTFPVLYEWSPNSGNFTPGTSFAPLPFGEYRIATMICYEDIIPTFVNKLVDAGDPHLFVNMTNDAWFGDTSEPWQHLALAKFRTIEHRKYLVRVTNSGVTAIIDPNGRTLVQSSTFREEALMGEVRMLEGKSIYARIGNGPWWLVTALLVAACFIHNPRDKKKPVSPSKPS